AGAAPHPKSSEIAAFWRAVAAPGDVHEVRVPKTRKGPRRWYGVVSGYFDDGSALVDALENADGRDAEGIYLTLNPVNPALLARANNRLQAGRPVTTQDADVLRRRHLLIDIDPARPAGISATAGEQAAALEARDSIADALAELGWPAPVIVMESGNGGALVYRIDLPNEDGVTRLVERVLRGLASAFDGERVTIDTGTANAARIFKVAGTIAAKGDCLPDRPWRRARAIYPDGAAIVPVTLLELVAAWSGERERRPIPIRPAVDRPSRIDIRSALREAGIGFVEKTRSYGSVIELDRCLTSGDHADGAAVIELASGALAYRCLHNSCRDMGWADVRTMLGFGGGGDPGPPLVVGGIELATGEIADAPALRATQGTE
ncbi:MAG: hypothetical protein ACR2J8_06170, partial [Thermomicrobiales bacterium]